MAAGKPRHQEHLEQHHGEQQRRRRAEHPQGAGQPRQRRRHELEPPRQPPQRAQRQHHRQQRAAQPLAPNAVPQKGTDAINRQPQSGQQRQHRVGPDRQRQGGGPTGQQRRQDHDAPGCQQAPGRQQAGPQRRTAVRQGGRLGRGASGGQVGQQQRRPPHQIPGPYRPLQGKPGQRVRPEQQVRRVQSGQYKAKEQQHRTVGPFFCHGSFLASGLVYSDVPPAYGRTGPRRIWHYCTAAPAKLQGRRCGI